MFKNVLRKSGQCALLVTEEEDDPVAIPAAQRGEYVVVRWVGGGGGGLGGWVGGWGLGVWWLWRGVCRRGRRCVCFVLNAPEFAQELAF